jgi:hypothetical protein
MSTMNFSVPDDVKTSFNEVFADQNKSAVVVQLMREALERVKRPERSLAATQRLIKHHPKALHRSAAALARARAAGRP